LGVAGIADLQPAARLVGQVRGAFPFGDDAFEVVAAGKLEKSGAVFVNVVDEQQAFGFARNDNAQALLAPGRAASAEKAGRSQPWIVTEGVPGHWRGQYKG
jgi:hypothetical protein